MQSASKPWWGKRKREHLHNIGAWYYSAKLDLWFFILYFLNPLPLSLTPPLFPPSLPPSQSQGPDCSVEAWQRSWMGKVQGRQLTLPASLNQRVNLHWGHNGFSLAKPPHMQAACHQPSSCSLTAFCLSLSSHGLYVQSWMYTLEVIFI